MVPYFRCFTSSKCGRTRLFRNQTLSMERNWSVEQRNSTIWVTEPQLVTVFRIECPCVDRKPVWISLSWKICGVNVTSNGWQCYIHNTNTSTHQVSLESWRRKKTTSVKEERKGKSLYSSSHMITSLSCTSTPFDIHRDPVGFIIPGWSNRSRRINLWTLFREFDQMVSPTRQ